MKKITRKITAAAALAAMCAGMLSGCGAKQTGTEGVTKVTVWTNSTHTKDIMQELVASYNENEGKEKGICIDYVVQGSDYQKVMDVAIQTKELPDLYYPINRMADLVKQNVVTAIEDMPGGAEFIEGYKAKPLSNVNIFGGKTYTLPYNVTTIGLLYNKDMFKAKGIVDENGEAKAPTTWSELLEDAKILTDPQAKQYGIALPLKWGGYFDWDLMRPFFASTGCLGYDSENNRYAYTKLTPAYEFLKQVKEDGSYYIGAEGLDNDPARAQFAEGNIGMKLGASWDVGVLNDQFPAKIDWGVARVPTIDEKPKYKQWMSADVFLAIASGIPDEKKEKVMEVYKWFHDEKMIAELYRKGKIVPADDEIIGKTQLENPSKGWQEFCALVKDSVALPPMPPITLEGDNYPKLGMSIWLGDIEPAAAMEDLEKRANEALDRAVEKGSIDFAAYKWDGIDVLAD